MPIFFQQQINESTRLGIWKIEETEQYFLGNVPLHRNVTHPHKRLQHLAGRFLLQFLYPGFPFELIRIAETRKPFLPEEEYHFSISHCGDFAAALVSTKHRVGVDIEIPVEKIERIKYKFLGVAEQEEWPDADRQTITLLWSSKEAVFKWYGKGAVEFREHILLSHQDHASQTIDCSFIKENTGLVVQYQLFDALVLAYVLT